jgi:hypothetical protein
MSWPRKSAFVAAIIIACASTSAVSKAHVNFALNLNVGPPPPIVEAVPEPRPGLVWVPGYWEWDGRRHAWREGHWLHARPGWVWEPAHWEEREGRWFFYPGHWERA